METAADCREVSAPTRKRGDRPVDLVHLSRYTLGARDLEREVLELFCDQSGFYLARLREAPSDQHWHDAAHSLKGSALAIGAWRAAEAAALAETLAGPALRDGRHARLRELESSVEEAKAFIRSLF
jgi:HPt (histidine-containing phosphotransfer) domain-containing protein